MQPLTLSVPKPLVKVKGTRMIDGIIAALHANGITEIYIVVGYKKEQFEYLKSIEGITLIDNPFFDRANNIASLYCARKYLEDAIVLDGDQIIVNPKVLRADFEKSGYNAVWTEEPTKEWLMQVENNRVISCSRNGGNLGWQLFSVSRWTKEDGERLRDCLEREFVQHKNCDIYWDDLALFIYPDDFDLGIMKMQLGDVIEIDDLQELATIDESYSEYLEKE